MLELDTADRTAASYDIGYLDWKSWGNERFGFLKRSTAKYYQAELKRAGVLGPAKLDVLEVGFGNGAFLAFCKERGWSVAGTEINPDLVTIARQASFDAHPASALGGMPAESFDIVAAFDVLEHIPPGETIAFIRDLLRVLRPGGVIIAHFPNGDSPFGLVSQNGDATHVNAIGTEKARYYARVVGGELVVLAGEAQPILAGSMAHSVHRLVAWPLKAIVNLLVRSVFLPGANIDFCAPHLTMVMRKK